MSILFVLSPAGTYDPAPAEVVISEAKRAIARKFRRGKALTSPKLAVEALMLDLADREHEVFGMIFLDNQHRIIDNTEMFRGTIDGASVYPREVVKAALACNAAAVMFYHNHPSGGLAQPSEADRSITNKLKQALGMVDIRVLDHFILSGDDSYSFAESGLL
jgi:DNA repair protein RadC